MKTKYLVRCPGAALRWLLASFLFFITGLAQAQVIPGVPPLAILCPPDQEVWTCTSNRVWQYPNPTVTGGCSGQQMVCEPPSGSTFPVGTTTVRCRVIDSCGQIAACSFSVIVRQDTEPPKIECPGDQTILACPTATGGCGALLTYPAPLVTDNTGPGNVSVQCNPPSGTFLQCGQHIVTCVAEDRCGNRSACRFTVDIREGGRAPSIQCPDDRVILTCSNSAVLSYPPPVVLPAGTAVVCVPPPGTVLPLGAHSVSCLASNPCGVAECKFTVTVRPAPKVDIQCPTGNFVFTIPCGSNCVPVVYPPPTVFNGALEGCFPPSGACLTEGTHVVICRATNECGAALCEFTVRVVRGPGEPPRIVCPNDMTIMTCSNDTRVFYPDPIVLPAGSVVKCVPPSGSPFPIGDTIVSCVASNPCGIADCKFTVTVRRTPPPVIRCPTNDLTFTIPCGSNCVPVVYPAPTVLNGALESCFPRPGTCLPEGTHVITCRATNECGASLCEFTIRVIKGQGVPPIIRCPTNDLTFTIPCGSNCVPVVYPAPTVLNGALESCFPRPGTCLPEGTHVITCRATNECGASLCEFTVRVVKGQGEPPIIRCPQDLTLVTCSNCAPLVFPRPVVINGALESCDPPPGTCLPVGEHVVKCTATNDCARASCDFRVKVVPAEDGPPRLSITKDGDSVIICWIKTCRCYKLQGARNLNPPIQWIDIPVDPVDVGTRTCVRIPISLRMQFFRLVLCDQPTAWVYDVTGAPITRATAGHLAEALGLSPDKLLLGDGSVRFLDPEKFQAVPTRRVVDPALIGDLTEASEDKKDLAFEGIDFDGLRSLAVLPPDIAIDRFSRALRAAELLPANADPVPRHTLFEVQGVNGDTVVAEKPIDTRVNFQFDLGGIPLIGPGAKLNISFGPDGQPTSLLGAFREHKPFREIPIIPASEAARRCQQRFPGLGARISPRLVYFAPSLLLPAVQKIVPCYDCGGDAIVGSDAVNLLRSLIPATDDPAYTPDVALEAGAQGTLVSARAVVTGGTPPYTYQWSSSSVDLGGMFPPTAASIEYNAAPRDEARLETVRVVVLDANGVQVDASRVVVLGPGAAGALDEGIFAPAVAGVSDYGVERAVSDLCSGQQAAFNARMMPAGYIRQFNFSGLSAWERDFKQGGTGLDHVYADNADLTFYMGHGYGGGFTFEGNHDDHDLYYTDAVKAWGNKDLEWLALLSCSVMADTYDGKSCFARWSPTFDGLHLMLGFANTAYDHDGFAGTFADWMLGRFGFLPPMPVRASWLLATDSNQPGSVIASVMGVIGPAGMSDYNDYFHGRGPVGPDLRGSNIHGFWRIKY